MIKVFLTNAFEYERGNIYGTWITLPMDNEELKTLLDKCNMSEGNYRIADFEYVKPFDLKYNDDINTLNTVLQKLENSNNINELLALLDTEHITYLDILESDNIDDLIDDYSFLYLDRNFSNDELRVGYALAEDSFIEIPDPLEPYFDYEAYGRDSIISGDIRIAFNDIAVI